MQVIVWLLSHYFEGLFLLYNKIQNYWWTLKLVGFTKPSSFKLLCHASGFSQIFQTGMLTKDTKLESLEGIQIETIN